MTSSEQSKALLLVLMRHLGRVKLTDDYGFSVCILFTVQFERPRYLPPISSPSDQSHTGIGVGPEPSTVAADIAVPLPQLGNGDAVHFCDRIARLVRLDKVEARAIGHNVGLRG
jgi:hypothetical protein